MHVQFYAGSRGLDRTLQRSLQVLLSMFSTLQGARGGLPFCLAIVTLQIQEVRPMARSRLYATDADRQRAYRQRLADGRPAGTEPPPTPTSHKRLPSRPARLARLVDDVQKLTKEYQNWLDALPDALQDTPVGEKLAGTLELLNTALELLSDIDPPKGFGRD